MADIRDNIVVNKKNRLEKLAKKTDFNYIDLTAQQENQLFFSIVDMPIENQNLLIFKNYYNHSFDEIEDITGIENAKGEYINLVGILSEILNIDNAIISESSMQKICERVAEKINEDIMKDFEQFNDEIKSVNTAKKRPRFISIFSSKVASIALIFLISSALIVGANVYAQGKIFKWIVKTFDEYTLFNTGEEYTINKDNIRIKIGYIPENFELKKKTVIDSMDMYYYRNGEKKLIIKFLYSNVDTGLNTENVAREQFELDNTKVITWEKENKHYFVLNIKGIACQIYGDINKDEFIKIYNNISLN